LGFTNSTARAACDTHRVIIADRDQHQVDPGRPGQELHLERERGVPGVVDRLPAHRNDHTGGIGRVPAGCVTLDLPAVKRGHELHGAEGELVRAADVHGVTRAALIGAELRQLVRRHDRRPVFLRQRDRVTQMVAVSV